MRSVLFINLGPSGLEPPASPLSKITGGLVDFDFSLLFLRFTLFLQLIKIDKIT